MRLTGSVRNLIGSGDKAPPGGAMFVDNAGVSVRIQPDTHFVAKGGSSAIEIRGASDVGQVVYLGAFLLMTSVSPECSTSLEAATE